MRKLLAVMTLAVPFAVCSAYAQRGGLVSRGIGGAAHASGSFAGAHAAHALGIHSEFPAIPRFSGYGAQAAGKSPDASSFNRRYGVPRDGRFRRPYFEAYPVVLPYVTSGWLAPGYADPGTYYDQSTTPPSPAYSGDAQSIAPPPPPIDEQPQVPRTPSFRPDYVRPQQPVPEPTPNAPLTLIFKDGRPSEQIRNYMLTRSTLYVQDQHLRRIPVDQIDLEATAKVNFDSGIDFSLPTAVR